MTRDEMNLKYCMDAGIESTAIGARAVLSGLQKGNKKAAEETLNRLYSDWIVKFKKDDGKVSSIKLTGAKNKEDAIKMAAKYASRTLTGYDLQHPVDVIYQKKW